MCCTGIGTRKLLLFPGTAAQSFRRTSSLLVIEFVLPRLVSHADPQLEGRLMSDLNMLVVTGSRERSEHEWRALLWQRDSF
jgi:hypothetical protein